VTATKKQKPAFKLNHAQALNAGQLLTKTLLKPNGASAPSHRASTVQAINTKKKHAYKF
jgi:hypothetical protein